MASKSGEILTDNELDNISQDSDVIENDIHIHKLLVETPSSDNSTLTQTIDFEDEVLDSGCWTPPEFIFDPFAAAPEEFCVAPIRKKAASNPPIHTIDFKEEVLDSGCWTPPEFIFDPFAAAPEEFCVAPIRKMAASNPPIHTIDFKEEVLDSGCSTPPEFIFDPFAAGPDKLCLAPKRKKANRNPSRRQLRPGFGLSPSFDLESEFEDFEKEEIQNICKSFLDLIISDVLEICEVKMLLEEEGEGEEEGDGFRTPTEMPLRTAIADACPGAPMRPSLKIPDDVKWVMRRKLNFDLDLD